MYTNVIPSMLNFIIISLIISRIKEDSAWQLLCVKKNLKKFKKMII